MKRNMELIRKIALAIEDDPSGHGPDALSIEGFSAAQIGYHSALMIEAGLAKGAILTSMDSDGPEAKITSLTWDGHDFADAARNDTVWNKAMTTVKEKGASTTFQIFVQILKFEMAKHFGFTP